MSKTSNYPNVVSWTDNGTRHECWGEWIETREDFIIGRILIAGEDVTDSLSPDDFIHITYRATMEYPDRVHDDIAAHKADMRRDFLKTDSYDN